MPISFSCPYCGKQTSVHEQFAGQTGPCAACGKPVTIPGGFTPAYGYPPAVKSGGTVGAIAVIAIVLGVGGVFVIAILLALLLPAIQAAREAGRRASSMNNLRQISLAISMYHDTHGEFPPAVVTDANGQPLYSGRVLLLPFLEYQALYDQFDKSQPWNSPANQVVSQAIIPVFNDPSAGAPRPGQTDYLFVVGQGTLGEGGGPRRMNDILDGLSNTLCVIETKNSGISWAEPRDFDASQAVPLPPGNHPGINLGAFLDGSVQALPSDTSPEEVRAMATRAGGEVVNIGF